MDNITNTPRATTAKSAPVLGSIYNPVDTLPALPPLPVHHLPLTVLGISTGNSATLTLQTTRILKDNASISRFKLQETARDILPKSGIHFCHSAPQRHKDPAGVRILSKVEVKRHIESGKTHLAGVQKCASVWSCPVCAPIISERRRNELQIAMATAQEIGLTPYLLTLTIPHHAKQSLAPLIDKFSQARRVMKNRKTFKRYAAQIGLTGSVRALEVTHGANGWHTHSHEIIFVKPGQARPDAAQILAMWQDAAKSAGLPKPNIHGVDIQRADAAASYIAKWGASHELTKSHIKKGRGENSRTPFDILKAFQTGGDMQDAKLFQEYAKAMKGKRQLVYSKGLREMLSMDAELTDAELLKQEQSSEHVCFIDSEDWILICKRGKRGELLQAAEIDGAEGVKAFIAALKSEH